MATKTKTKIIKLTFMKLPKIKITPKGYLTLFIISFTLVALAGAYFHYKWLLKDIEGFTRYEISVPKKELKYRTAVMTMYNAGDPSQTDQSPCISSSGDNVCTLIAQGINVCASNFLPEGTIINVKGKGNCVVLDTMAKRYSDRLDWALPADKKDEAIAWGMPVVEYAIVGFEF